jgi:hypothetical protein
MLVGERSRDAECSRLRGALERCHKMILEDFTSEVRKAIPNWYEVEKAARAALKGGE